MSASYTKPVTAISACSCLERLYVVPLAPYYRIESGTVRFWVDGLQVNSLQLGHCPQRLHRFIAR